MRNFYMTLLSNSSKEYYPGNKTSSFSVQLPRYMYLDGQWEVSLADIQYPYTFTNVTDDQVEIQLETMEITQQFIDWYKQRTGDEMPNFPATKTTLNILPGFYSDIKDIIGAINDEIGAHTQQKSFFVYNNKAQRVGCVNSGVAIGTKWVSSCKLCPRLALQLGFKPGTFISAKGNFAPNVANSGVIIPDKMLIYCNILEPQIIGDTWGKVLRIVSTNAGIDRPYYGQSCSINFNPSQYIPVQAQNFDTISIDIKDILGELIPFNSGALTVKLHFRKRR